MDLHHEYSRVIDLIRPERRRYALGLSSLFLVNISDVLAPVFMALAIDLTEGALNETAPNTPTVLSMLGIDAAMFSIVGAALVFLTLHVIANVCRYPMMMLVAVPSHQIGQNLRRRIADYLLQQTQSFYDRSKSGDLMSTATADVLAVRMMLGPGVLVGADTLMLVSLVIIVLAILSWKLTLIAALPIPVIYWVTNKLSHQEYKAFKVVQDDLAKMTERARESYAGIRIIQGYAREKYDQHRFDEFSLRHYRKNLTLARIHAVFEPTLDLFTGISTVLVLTFGGYWVAHGEMTLGTFVAFLFLIRYLSGPMIGLGWAISLFQRGRASLDRIEELTSAPIEILEKTDAQVADGLGLIEVRDLTFSYPVPRLLDDEDARPDKPVIRDISFTLAPGKTLGIFGPVGSGKSTIATLLTRLYDPPEGTVFVDGVDIHDLTLSSLRRQIVLAPQETFLFSTTVSQNIVLAQPTPQEDETSELEEFSRLAHLHAEVENFVDGYDTLLGERGVNLSGGQRQRLAIARAIAADPTVLVLDDCLSAVDSHTEEAILKNLRTLFGDRSGIIISHRVRAVQDCDEILVMEGGEVVQRGSHESLIEQGGYYAQIAAQQTSHGSAA